MLKDDLITFGLDGKESLLYLSLLELGEASVLNIARKSGLKRTSVYHLLESLKNRGFVGIINKKNKQFYFAQNPQKLESELAEKQATLKKMMPELLSLANLIDKKPKIQYFEGKEGMKDVFRDILNYHDNEVLAWYSEDYISTIGQSFFDDYYNPQRLKNKIWSRTIHPDTETIRERTKDNEKELKVSKYVNDKNFELPIEIQLYGKKKVGIISLYEGISLIIESEKIFRSLKSIFEVMWNSLPKEKKL